MAAKKKVVKAKATRKSVSFPTGSPQYTMLVQCLILTFTILSFLFFALVYWRYL